MSTAGGTSAELQVPHVLAGIKFFLVLRPNHYLLPHQNGRRLDPCHDSRPARGPSASHKVVNERASFPIQPYPIHISPAFLDALESKCLLETPLHGVLSVGTSLNGVNQS